MLRVVLDTNVVISAIISPGKPRELLEKGIYNQFCIVTTDLLLKELAAVLKRPKFKTSKEEIITIRIALTQSAQVVKVKSRFEAVREDPKDDMVLESAYDGQADLIVSGDRHLLKLESFRGIKIVSVEELLKMLQRSGDP
jgi:uncharacterized protein